MRIAFSMRVVEAVGYSEPRDAISHDWITWAQDHGHDVILVPNALNEPGQVLEDMNAEALVLTGGNDLVPRPGQEGDTSELRTRAEIALLEKAIALGLPVLATCRGMHLVNSYFGGQVVPQLANAQDHVATAHNVTLLDSISELCGYSEMRTNSFHNQGVDIDGVAAPLVAFAMCQSDSTVEGVFHRDLPILGLQWHPERPNPAQEFDQFVISELLTRGAFWKEKKNG